MIVFGGWDTERKYKHLNDVWALDLTPGSEQWYQLADNRNAPGGRMWASAVYDSRNEQLILFGGYDWDHNDSLNDVWSLDLQTRVWTELNPSGRLPKGRDSHAAIYDLRNGRMVIALGWDRRGLELADSWALDLTLGKERWYELALSGRPPHARYDAPGVYDSCNERMIVFGGYDGNRSYSDTWGLDLVSDVWTQLQPSGSRPVARDSHVAGYDPEGSRMVMFSGWDSQGKIRGDTWSLSLPCGGQRDTPTLPPSPTAPPSPTMPPTAESTPMEPTPTQEPPTATPSSCDDPFETDNEWYQARLLGINAGPQRHRIQAPGDVDYVKIVVESGHNYTIRTLDLAPVEDLDTRLFLYDTDGTTLLKWNDDDPSNPPASRIDWTCTDGGTYFAKVANLNPEAGDCPMEYSIEAVEATTPMPTRPVYRLHLPYTVKNLELVPNTPTPLPSPTPPPYTPTPWTPVCDPGFESGHLGPWMPGSACGDDVNLASAIEPLTADQAAKLDSVLRGAYEQVLGTTATDENTGESPAASDLSDTVTASNLLDVEIPPVVTQATNLRIVVSSSNVEALRCAGVTVRAQIGDVVSAVVRADRLDDVVRLPSVVRVEAPRIMQVENDLGRQDARVPEAVQAYNATGRGVIVGIIDSGIDFTHDAFIDANGRTRIKAILDLADPGDTDGDGDLDGYGPAGGTLYTEDEINQAIQDERAGRARVYRSTGDAQDIPDYGKLSARISVPSGAAVTIESLYLQVQIEHDLVSDLSLTLVSPGGQRITVLDPVPGQEDSLVAHYEIPGLDGTSTRGTWTLEVRDRLPSDEGKLIYWALHANRVVREEDVVGHGTHVAGTAAGDDARQGTAQLGQYAGVAPEADIVVVRATRNLENFATDDIIDALEWLDRFARDRGQPYVANLSLGGNSGPRDGTTHQERAIDGLVGEGKPGKAIVTSAGNSGDMRGHASGQFTSFRNSVDLTIPALTYGDVIEVWFEGPETLKFGIRHPGGFDCMPGCDDIAVTPGGYGQRILFHRLGTVLAYADIFWEAKSPYNNLYEMWVLLAGNGAYLPRGKWELVFGRARGDWNAWSWFGEPFGRRGDNRMTIGSPAAARNIIAVGSHATRLEWTDSTGKSWRTEGTLGGLSDFSSRGPTRDGRTKPDLTAPGEWIISARSRSAAMESDYVISSDHAIMPGTSMAAPHVTGAVALLMGLPGGEALDAIDVRDLLTTGARVDSHVGSAPNDDWGAGKLDAHETLALSGFPRYDPSPPTATLVPPTSTPIPPTATRVPPTSTPVPPTATPYVWPTATVAVPTVTATPYVWPTATTVPPEQPTPTPVPLPGDECWYHGGELPGRVVCGPEALTGQCAALLGDPSLGAGLPGGNSVPVGSAWIEQVVTIPDTPGARLTFQFNMTTYDIMQDDMRKYWDLFTVQVDGVQEFEFGNALDTEPGQRRDFGWQEHTINLSSKRGQTVTLRFTNWNGYSRGRGAEQYNTWTYVDDVYVLP